MIEYVTVQTFNRTQVYTKEFLDKVGEKELVKLAYKHYREQEKYNGSDGKPTTFKGLFVGNEVLKKVLYKEEYQYIFKALNDIQSGIDRNDDYGICHNLQKKVLKHIEKGFIYAFLQRSIKDILNPENSQYPIEGDYISFKANTLKWSPLEEFGQKRLVLLKNMIDYVDCKILEAESWEPK